MHWLLNRNQSQKQNVFWTFQSHIIHLLALLGPLTDPNDRFPYPLIYLNHWNHYPFLYMYLKPKKGNPFRWSLPVYAIVGIPLGYIGKSSQPSSVDPLFINESIFKNRLQLDVCTKKCASNNTRLIKARYQISATLGVVCPLIACASFYYCTSYIKPSLSNKPPPHSREEN